MYFIDNYINNKKRTITGPKKQFVMGILFNIFEYFEQFKNI